MVPQTENISSLKNWIKPECSRSTGTAVRPQQVTTTPLSISDKLHLQKLAGPPTYTISQPLAASSTPCCLLARERSEVRHFSMTPSKMVTRNALKYKKNCKSASFPAHHQRSAKEYARNSSLQTCPPFCLDFIFCCSSHKLVM